VSRIRTIKPEFFKHVELFDLEAESGLPIRVAFAALWTVADREGRFKWVARQLKIECLPYDDVDFSRVLDALSTREFIKKYTVKGVDYGWIPGFKTHQVINNRESPSNLPDPSNDEGLTRAARVDDASATREVHAQAEGKGREGKGREGVLSGASPDRAKFKTETIEIFEFWKHATGKPESTQLTDKRHLRIHDRLCEGYSVEDIKTAIKNCSQSRWHMGNNDRKTQYNDVELICRSGEKLEYFRDSVGVSTRGPPEQFSDITLQNILNIEDWLQHENH